MTLRPFCAAKKPPLLVRSHWDQNALRESSSLWVGHQSEKELVLHSVLHVEAGEDPLKVHHDRRRKATFVGALAHVLHCRDLVWGWQPGRLAGLTRATAAVTAL